MSPGRSPPSFLRNTPLRSGSGTPPTGQHHNHHNHAAVFSEQPEPDETTGIVMRGPNNSAPSAIMNYQGTATTESSSTGPRARKNGYAAATTMTASSTGRRRDTASGNGNGSGNANGNGTACDDGHGDAHHQDKEAAAWWKTQLAKFGSIELENKGSVARDHLALGMWMRLFSCFLLPSLCRLFPRAESPSWDPFW